MVRKIERFEDEVMGKATYDLGDGRMLCVDARDVRRYGLKAIMRQHGVELPDGRVPVFQSGREIGSVPAAFEPFEIKPTSILYDVRPGDFKRTNDGWEAARTLGPGDFEAVPGFQWADPT